MRSARQYSQRQAKTERHRPGAGVDSPDLNDSQLLIAIARGEYSALAEVYSRHGGRVFGVARQVCGAEAAADVVKAVFLRLWHQPEDFGPQSSPLEALLLTMAHRGAVRVVRQQPHERASHPTSHMRQSESGPDVESWAKRRGIDDDTAWDRLSSLPRAERDAIALAYFGGHTYTEVASTLGLQETTARRRIRRGLARLSDE